MDIAAPVAQTRARRGEIGTAIAVEIGQYPTRRTGCVGGQFVGSRAGGADKKTGGQRKQERLPRDTRHRVPRELAEIARHNRIIPGMGQNYPPIEYIGRGGATNFGELISWPIHLAARFSRMTAAISSSGACDRSKCFTSVSSMANRQ